MSDYYSRRRVLHVDGSEIFKSADDEAHEREVAEIIGRAWRCELRRFGALSPIDWFAERDGRLIGIVELKSRSHASSRYSTVLLNVRKWLALSVAGIGLGIPAAFIVQFTDVILWTLLSEVDAHRHAIGGCLRIVKSRSDIEPVIHVPIADMRRIAA